MVLCDLKMRVLWWCWGVVGGGSVGVAQCVHRRPVDAAVVGERGGVCVCVVGVLKADTVLVYVVMKMMQKNGEGAS